MSQWVNICSIDDILPATGVCALLGQQQVAIFRPYHDDRVFAISNIDPFFNASVLSRGIIAEHDGASKRFAASTAALMRIRPVGVLRYRLSDSSAPSMVSKG